MKNKIECMIDIETLAVPENVPAGVAVEVVQIAAVLFDENGIHDEINLFPREGNGLADPETVRWWMTLPVPAWLDERNDADCPEALASMAGCLKVLAAFVGPGRPVWSKGGFDLDILQHHAALERLPRLWEYWQRRDLRTVMKEMDYTLNVSAEHDALVDARQQVADLLEFRRILRAAELEPELAEVVA